MEQDWADQEANLRNDWKAPEKEIARQKKLFFKGAKARPLIEVFPENVEAFRLLMFVESQWETPGEFGGRCTIAFTEVEAAARMLGLKPSTDLFQRVRIMIACSRSIRIDAINKAKAEAKRK